ncbi:DUF1643 domain-containing protein [Streptomyces sp. 35M1]|uniref:DUF1643 domain-containing protein n=1 Tax=Streptomyces sp. 35M1 TaxID=3142978 RepID=UPI00399051EB
MIPAAIAALVTAVADEHPLATPEELGRFVVKTLADDGWQITPEPARAPMSAEYAPCRPKRRAYANRPPHADRSATVPPSTVPPETDRMLQPIAARTAEISSCGRYRYRLTREWSAELPPATFVMLNPSTADGDQDDATVRKCMRYARSWGCGSLVIVNLYAWRATSPRDLPADESLRIGPDGDAWLSQAALDALDADGPLVAAWGTHGTEQRVADVLTLPGMSRLSALAVTRDGHPGHPLYLRSGARPADWSPRGVR